ncbi:MAG: glycoside hydrolase family 15 protein [Dehalococcoidia bacterium]
MNPHVTHMRESSSHPYPPISDYGLISDMHSCALVSRSGSIDWACFPRFDSPSVFGRLLDWNRGGCFELTVLDIVDTHRRYLPGTNILETRFQTETGTAILRDCMPVPPHARIDRPRELGSHHQVLRVLQCIDGVVRYRLTCYPRFDYGTVVPHAEFRGGIAYAHGGGHAVSLYCSEPLRVHHDGFRADGTLRSAERLRAALTYHSGRNDEPEALNKADIDYRFAETELFWEEWSGQCTYNGRYRDTVLRSALALKALTYSPSGALVAAATTSLPESIGGTRNWDYRFTWLRDATFALYALAIVGFKQEVHEFKKWLEWATAGRARDLQIMYGLQGERRLVEHEIPELEGYRGSRPVRYGNAAYRQFQLDIYGELLDAAHIYRRITDGQIDDDHWAFLCDIVETVIERWREPDEGIWEVRGQRLHFVFSKVMCWVALDRAIRAAIDLGLHADLDRWTRERDIIRADILQNGYNPDVGAFVQAYGSDHLDASVLMLPLVKFIPATDERMRSTVRAIERELCAPNGFIYRYRSFDDGIPGQEGAFTICTFWLADNLILMGEVDRGRALFEKVIAHENDLGLHSEQIDPATGTMLGNFPQAFSHLAAINTAVLLDRAASAGK